MKLSRPKLPSLCAGLTIVFLSACSNSAQAPSSNQDPSSIQGQFEPEPAAQIEESNQKTFLANEYLAVTANPYATRAATKILEKGGSAIDAAIAAQLVLGLVEPQSSGLGGGGFLVYWDNQNKKLITYDGRETAPLSVDENLFVKQPATDSTPAEKMSFFNAVLGGRSVGTPGLIKMLEEAHDDYGLANWDSLFKSGVDLAENGFVVSARLNQLITHVPAVNARPDIASYLFDNEGKPLAEGSVLKNPAYGETLKAIDSEGSKAFYAGENAQQLIEAVQNDGHKGFLGLKDLESYEVKDREAVCAEVFQHKVCGMAPPSSGPTTVIAILKTLEQRLKSTATEAVNLPESLDASPLLSHYFIEATRLAFADRNTYLADPDFVNVPTEALISDNYLANRAALIDDDTALNKIEPGNPENDRDASWIEAPSSELASTTHLSIIDTNGNIVSMTTSIETAFGSRLMAGGYILNNQLTDFSFLPETADRKKIANRVQAGKRPLSSMSPMIVFDQSNQPVMAIGSPGGKSIIAYVARTLFEVLFLERPLEEAINDTHIVHTRNRLVVEEGAPDDLIDALKEKGHSPTLKSQASGIHALQRRGDRWFGVADKRREGIAAGR